MPSIRSRQTASIRAMATVSKMAGVRLKTARDEVQLSQRGISPDVIDQLKQLGTSSAELHWIIKPRTLAHRKSKGEDLTQEETGRWLRVAKIQALALEVFGSKEKAISWLRKPTRSFDDQSALVLLQSEAGAQLVEDKLNQLDAGYFA
ncbi:antitoxin Xre/MbcA/ParS toxin-binding domain-containing protein [uncultured Pseudoteredinibacter sp.]|uniref:antitoxin Xre/MbcA/ParS toxin-binding domain-containing protein n=1 Tax=uncultured Pseudoteredinibacter sp. TaxID=1641701 RepID=UPI00261015D3|nr:antitoxin Xre/MbcA/ParS toxin-binding domain-containing protein [uncultured Pseudoteredinibacter sp.]